MVQVPAARKAAEVPVTEQMVDVVDAKLTGSPELLVATRASCVPTVCAGMFAKVIDWDCSFTVNLRVTIGAAAYVAFPGWAA